MNTSEWMLVLIALVGAVVNYLQQRQQNQIFREQNQIFADQGGKTMPPEKPRPVWLKRYWPTLITVLLFLLIGYDIYDRHAHNSSVSSTTSVPWPYGALLLLIAIGLGLIIGRSKRDASNKNIDAVLAGLPKQPSAPPLPKSKLVINWADYRAVENVGEVYPVGDFLQQIISGNSLIFDIENHNFTIGDKNFVPHDPAPFKEKRLKVNYSYAGGQPVTTERREHGRLLLPEDSKIKWLTGRGRSIEGSAASAREGLRPGTALSTKCFYGPKSHC
jgi:hypothetical protein